MSFIKGLFFLFLLGVLTHSCGKRLFIRNTEAREDALEYERAVKAQAQSPHLLEALFETVPVSEVGPNDDAADDPAIWYNPVDPAASVVFGSNKKAGIHSYDLAGNEIQFVPCGKINNVDVRQGIKTLDGEIDVVAGSNRTDNSISVFLINKEGRIDPGKEFKIGLGGFEPYGFCLAKTPQGELHAFVNNKDGYIYQFGIQINEGELNSTRLRQLKVDTQPEGMIVDDETEMLYIGEEQKGVHYVSSRADAPVKTKLLRQSTSSNAMIRYDIEGLALFSSGERKYLLASVQGSFSYAIFDLEKNNYVTSFAIKAGEIDGVEETDGLEILQMNLGGPFHEGILVVQDGFNQSAGGMLAQNFKYVPLGEVLRLIP